MMSEDRSGRKVSLEDLLRLKRAERPPTEFWTEFDRELRTRQLAAAVGKRRWWYGLPQVFARYQMPMGAAAVLAVTFLTLRDYREPGLEPAYLGSPETAERVAEPMWKGVTEVSSVPVYETLAVAETVRAAAAAPTSRPDPETSPSDGAGSANRHALPGSNWVDGFSLTPSARSIAANLAAVESERGARPMAPLAVPVVATGLQDPLAQLVPPPDSRRERLLAYAVTEAREFGGEHDGPRATERIGTRINEYELYDSVRRLSGGGDRLTLRF